MESDERSQQIPDGNAMVVRNSGLALSEHLVWQVSGRNRECRRHLLATEMLSSLHGVSPSATSYCAGRKADRAARGSHWRLGGLVRRSPGCSVELAPPAAPRTHFR